MKRVVITGLGAITPLGNCVNDYWKNLINGVSGAALISRFDTTHFKTKFACEVKGFDPLKVLQKSEARKMDLYTKYAIAAAEECMEDAGFDKEKWDLNKTGVIWASAIGGIESFEDAIIEFTENNMVPRFSPFYITKLISNMAAGYISIRYGLRGVSYSVTSACASSNSAIVDACNYIRLGKSKAIIVGGSEAAITRSAIGGFNASKALSTNNDNFKQASRPFDKNRDGFVFGEGAAALMLEDLDHALERGANIYCELAGTGISSDAYHPTATHPDGLGAKLAMEEAMEEANVTPADVDYINAHATSTPMGDPCECRAIDQIFKQNYNSLHVSATKSMTGHLLGAAGASEAIAAILAIKNGIIPPTINLIERDDSINPEMNLTENKAVEKEVNIALNNTFGFGGHIAVSLFKKFQK